MMIDSDKSFKLSKKEIVSDLVILTGRECDANSILVFETVDSTNDEATRRLARKRTQIANGNKNKSTISQVLIANEQTRGKGRLGRHFDSPKDSGLYMSIVINPSFEIGMSILVTTMTCSVVNKILKDLLGIESQIKWVNDIYVDEKKVAGVLVEGAIDNISGKIENIIVGIGINCYTKAFSELAGTNAGAISTDFFSRNRLAAHIIAGMEELIEDMDFFNLETPTEKQKTHMQNYTKHSMVLDKEIIIVNTGKKGLAVDIGVDGGLIVEYTDGTREKILSGEVSIQMSS